MLDPLKDLLEQVLSRLEALEAHAGISAPIVTSSSREGVSVSTQPLSSSSTHSKGTGKCCEVDMEITTDDVTPFSNKFWLCLANCNFDYSYLIVP